MVQIVGDENKAEVVRQLLIQAGVCLPGKDEHYVGVSDKHLAEFYDIERLFVPENAERLQHIVFELACDVSFMELTTWGKAGMPQILVGPADGGNKLVERLAPILAQLQCQPVQIKLTEKVPGTKEFRFAESGPDLRGQRVLVIDDVMTSGLSARNTVRICREAGAEVIGIYVIVDRENWTAEGLEVPHYGFLLAVNAVSYDVPKFGQQVCPLCRANVRINTEVGHGAEFVAKHGQPHFIESGN